MHARVYIFITLQGGGAFCAESGVNAEVLAAYGYSIAIEKPLSPSQGAPLFNDLVTLFKVSSSTSSSRFSR